MVEFLNSIFGFIIDVNLTIQIYIYLQRIGKNGWPKKPVISSLPAKRAVGVITVTEPLLKNLGQKAPSPWAYPRQATIKG